MEKSLRQRVIEVAEQEQTLVGRTFAFLLGEDGHLVSMTLAG